MNPRTVAIIQARMSSQRLPHKVLHKISNKPMLQYLLERIDHCDRLDGLVVATSTDTSDDVIEEYCAKNGIECHRGALNDVAGRFNQVLNIYRYYGFVRVNGDSPLLDQRLIDKGISLFLREDFDVVTNVFPRSYPKGQSVEVLKTSTFQKAYQSMREADDLEHVTQFFYKHEDNFRIHNFSLTANLNNIQLSVDTKEDLDLFNGIISSFTRPHWEYTLEDILNICRELEPRNT